MTSTRTLVLDEVVQKLEDYILSGDVRPGDKMPTEVELCQTMGIGRSTVREALKMIQTMGYLETRPGKGNYILSTTKSSDRERAVDWFVKNECETMELLEFRKFLEPYVAHLATQRMTEKEIIALGETMDCFERAYYANDLRALNKYEKLFHASIVNGGHNKVFISIYESLMRFLNEYFAMSFSIRETAEQSLYPHKRIYEAMLARNADLAKAEMHAHIELTIANMVAVVKGQKEDAR